MKVRVVAVSQRQPAWIDAGVAEYSARLPRAWSFELVELRPAPRDGGRTALQILDIEATRIAAATAGRRTVALDERGTSLTTQRFAEMLAQWRDAGVDVDFVIGSADGLAASVKKSAAAVVALSALTLPHGLARVLLVEQLYRAQSLLAGHPYHRA
jgi:23S rRNA (pseudouridine1915-N3)-methyltransferase